MLHLLRVLQAGVIWPGAKLAGQVAELLPLVLLRPGLATKALRTGGWDAKHKARRLEAAHESSLSVSGALGSDTST